MSWSQITLTGYQDSSQISITNEQPITNSITTVNSHTIKANSGVVLDLQAVRDGVVESFGPDDDRQVVDEGLDLVQVEALPGGDVVDTVG